ncbi:DUF2249 domain-containing protein [Saccharopolyspora rhizosphaerae]|uniref:DUF2249 domain-containing protein n=1 Tax=Saccharopolyspora rhizosphaerae TaxID=2492662 RepID=A0A426JRG1_9PSEU|nr:DUF2249 domain-containing protein [Saccharopolyspora rhizosphaerae]RRO15742.1 DUF2249 domain-containing protein [Saccharopolyspora rhizosphaerae]
MADQEREWDLRSLAEPEKRPTVLAGYADLPVGGSLVVVDDRDPQGVRAALEEEHPGSHDWEHLSRGPEAWRVRITKLTTTPLPRVLVNTDDVADGAAGSDTTGPVWKLPVRDRDLDSNVIALPPGGTIDAHTGPDVDVLVHVLSGSGRLGTERGEVDLRRGALLWLPRRSRRQFTAGDEGLRYLTVHQRRQALQLHAPPAP